VLGEDIAHGVVRVIGGVCQWRGAGVLPLVERGTTFNYSTTVELLVH
jgi:hypothetical protein